MATIIKKQTERNYFDHTPYGNVVALRYTLETDGTGAVVMGDKAIPVDNGDTVTLGVLPAGLRMFDSEVVITTGMTATITGKLGFAYQDGVNSTAVPQDDAYFGTGLDLASAARLRNAVAKGSVTLPKPAFLNLTTAVAKNIKASKIEVVILAIAEGRP